MIAIVMSGCGDAATLEEAQQVVQCNDEPNGTTCHAACKEPQPKNDHTCMAHAVFDDGEYEVPCISSTWRGVEGCCFINLHVPSVPRGPDIVFAPCL